MGGKFSTISNAVAGAAGLFAAALIPGTAQAGGDIGAAPPPAGVPLAPGRTIWEGFHAGAHAGWSDFDYGIGQRAPASPLVTISDDEDAFAGGFLYGSSWQFGKWVVGTDSVYSFADSETGLNIAANGRSAKAEVDWSSESRLRAGLLVQPNTLVYGTVGIAFADLNVSGTLVGRSQDETAFGVAYGGGVETTMGNRWFARVEYVHIDYDDENFREVGGGRLNVDLETDIVRGAVGYRFDWSPLDLLKGR